MPVPVEERTKSGTKAFQIPQILCNATRGTEEYVWPSQVGLKRRENENKTAVCPYCPDQAVGAFSVSERLNNCMLETDEAALAGVFTLGFLTAYGIMYFVKFSIVIAKYFKGIQK